jgi:hypothetical protein
MCAAVRMTNRVCKPMRLLQLLVVTCCVYKCSVNRVTNPNPVYSHTQTRDNYVFTSLFLVTASNNRDSSAFVLTSFHGPLRKHRSSLLKSSCSLLRICYLAMSVVSLFVSPSLPSNGSPHYNMLLLLLHAASGSRWWPDAARN